MRVTFYHGIEVTGAGVSCLLRYARRGVRLWGISVGWLFVGVGTCPKNTEIRSRPGYVDEQAILPTGLDEVA